MIRIIIAFYFTLSILFAACIPKTVITPMDSRATQISQSVWSLYSEDSVYLSGSSVQYTYRKKHDSCFQALLFLRNSNLQQHDSCSTSNAQVTFGSWLWHLSDSLYIQFPGSNPSLRSFRYTMDTLQLFADMPIQWDSVQGQRIYPVKTFVRL